MKRKGRVEGKGREGEGGEGPTQMLEPGPPVTLLCYWTCSFRGTIANTDVLSLTLILTLT